MQRLQARALDQALRRHPLDRERLICTGTSASGKACWELALSWPGVFAGIWPVSAGHQPSPDARCLSNLEGLGMLVMHGDQDGLIPAARVEAAVEVARAAGARVELVRVPEAGHGNFGPELWEAGLRWASAQRRSPPPHPRRCGPAPRGMGGPSGR